MIIFIEKIMAFVVISALWMLFSLSGYWLFLDKSAPVNISVISINKKIAFVDDEMMVRYSVSPHRACDSISRRYLRTKTSPSDNFFISSVERKADTLNLGREFFTDVKWKVGRDIPAGSYEFYVKTDYACNPIQKIFPIILYTPPIDIEIRDITDIQNKLKD